MGRALKPGEVVRRENNDKDDYHPANLKVFSGQATHTVYHHYLRREAEGVGHLLRWRSGSGTTRRGWFEQGIRQIK